MRTLIYYIEDLRKKIINAGFKSALDFANHIGKKQETVSRWINCKQNMSLSSQYQVIKALKLKKEDIKSKLVNNKSKK